MPPITHLTATPFIQMSPGPQLKVVATMSVGTLHIDITECKKRGIVVANTPDVAADSAAEFTVTLLLMVTRRCLEG